MWKNSVCRKDVLQRLLLWGSATSLVLLLVSFRSLFSAVLCVSLSLFSLFLCLRRSDGPLLPASSQISYLTAACVFSAVAGKRFFDYWKTSLKLDALAATIGMSGNRLALLLTLAGCLAAIPFLLSVSARLYRNLDAEYRKEIEKRFRYFENCPLSKAVIFLLLLYFVAFFPLFRANFNYVDDNGRVFLGYTAWDNFSRYLSNFLSGFIHADEYLSDISPLPQIIAILLLVLASVAVVKVFKGNRPGISLWDLIAVIPLGLSPYFLENMSYKMDAPYMALSVLASVFPLLFCHKNRLVYLGTTFFSMLVVCMTYQAASGIFPMAVVLLAFGSWCKKERSIQEILRFVLESALAYLSSLGLFFFFLMRPPDAYVSTNIAPLSTMLSNYRDYLGHVRSDFHPTWLLLIFLLVVWYIAMSVYHSRWNKALTFFLSACVTIAAALLSFGVYPAFAAPLTAPRAMYGVGAFIAFIGVGNIAEKEFQPPLRVITTILAWAFITFACCYGNALAAQQEYENFRREAAIRDLTNLEEFYSNSERKKVQITGSVGYAPAIRETAREYKMLNRLVPIQFRGQWAWGVTKFENYYGLNETITCDIYENVEDFGDWPILHESFYHTIYYRDGNFILELK